MIHKGFNYSRKTYIWKNGELYRLPFSSVGRTYGLKKVTQKNSFFVIGNGVRKSMSQVLGMTIDIEVDFTFPESKDVPF